MRHATNAALDKLEDVLVIARSFTQLKEKKRGVFYSKSSAFLHFHEDPVGLFADLRVGDDFKRFAVNTPAERKEFASILKDTLAV